MPKKKRAKRVKRARKAKETVSVEAKPMAKGFQVFLMKSLFLIVVYGAIVSLAHVFEKEFLYYEVFFNPVFTQLFALSLAFFFFCLITRERISFISEFKANKALQAVFFIAAIALFAYRFTMPLSPARWAVTAAAGGLLALSVYGAPFTRFLLKSFWKQLIASAAVLAALLLFIESQALLFITTQAAYLLFVLVHPSAWIDWAGKWPVVGANDFSAYITSYCSGIESMTLFSVFFLLALVMRFRRLDYKKFVAAYFLGVGGAYALAVLRMWVLFLVGANFSSEMAFDLFHSYASLVVFINYFFLFWVFSRDWMEKPGF